MEYLFQNRGNRMSENDIDNSIQREFNYLFTKFDFHVVYIRRFKHFGNWVVLLYSPDFRIRIYCDRGEVTLAIGPDWLPQNWEAGPWFDLAIVLEFITQQQYDLRMTIKEATENEQIMILSEYLENHIDQIKVIFSEQIFKKQQKRLNQLHEKKEALFWPELYE
jgi:hypothetical protein